MIVFKPRGPHSHILLMGMGKGGGSEGVFWGLKLWPKGFFWVYERCGDFLGREKCTGIFWGIVLFISNISAIYCCCGIFFLGMLKM